MRGQLHNYDPEVLEAILRVEILGVETPFTKLQGTIIPAISGSVSAISSSLIIYIIHKLRNGLSTTYHRIMFGMSIMDIAESLMMVISTLPMPRDMVYHQFRALSIGNNMTCQAQAAVVNAAGMGTLAYNAALCFYYLCSISFRVSYEDISKYIEPVLHLFSIGWAIFLGTAGIVGRFYNPMPYQSWCSVATFPYWCSGDGIGSGIVTGVDGSLTEYNECSIVSSKLRNLQSALAACVFFIYIFIWVVITFSMLSVIITVLRRGRILKRHMNILSSKRIKRKTTQNDTTEEDGRATADMEKNHRHTKVILIQSVAYILACLMVQIFPTLNFNLSKKEEFYTNNTYAIILMIFFPLQGFYNFLIFISHKIYTLKVADENVKISEAFRKVLTCAEEPIFIISRISAVSTGNRAEEMNDPSSFDGVLSYADTGQQENSPNHHGHLSTESTNEGFEVNCQTTGNSNQSGNHSSLKSWFSRSSYFSKDFSNAVSSVG